jgi:hypothetical protein
MMLMWLISFTSGRENWQLEGAFLPAISINLMRTAIGQAIAWGTNKSLESKIEAQLFWLN